MFESLLCIHLFIGGFSECKLTMSLKPWQRRKDKERCSDEQVKIN